MATDFGASTAQGGSGEEVQHQATGESRGNTCKKPLKKGRRKNGTGKIGGGPLKNGMTGKKMTGPLKKGSRKMRSSSKQGIVFVNHRYRGKGI